MTLKSNLNIINNDQNCIYNSLINFQIWGLRSRPTLRSNRPGELAVTRKDRLGDRKLVFRFSKILVLKNTAAKVTLRNFTGTHVGRVRSCPGLS